MKKLMIATFAGALALAAGLSLPAGAAFSDTAGHWAETAITKWSEEYSIIGGYDDGSFRPASVTAPSSFSPARRAIARAYAPLTVSQGYLP